MHDAQDRRPPRRPSSSRCDDFSRAFRAKDPVFVFGDALAAEVAGASRAPRHSFADAVVETALVNQGAHVPGDNGVCGSVVGGSS